MDNTYSVEWLKDNRYLPKWLIIVFCVAMLVFQKIRVIDDERIENLQKTICDEGLGIGDSTADRIIIIPATSGEIVLSQEQDK